MSGIYEQLSGAAGIRQQGEDARTIAEYNAKVAEQEGKAAKAMKAFESERQAEEAQRIKSKQIAEIGKAGGLGSPVVVDIARAQEKESVLENLLIGYEGEVLSLRAGNRAALSRLQGEAAYQASKSQAQQANVQFGLQLASFAVPFLGGTKVDYSVGPDELGMF